MDLERLLTEHGDGLYRMCYLYLRDEALAQDAVQDAFLKAMTAQFRGDCSEETFLTRIAANVCKDYLRSPWKKRRVSLDGLEERRGEGPPEAVDDTLPKAVMGLPRKYREVIILYYYRELQAKEIAELLHVGVSTVTARLTRARKLLREGLKGWYYDEM